jgi:rSAM/selenodomain-associated transferase 1
MVDSTLLQQFARAGVPGTMKTRLIGALSAEQAASLHGDMVCHTCSTLCHSGIGEVELWLSGDQQEALVQRCRQLGEFTVRQQSGHNLGARMAAALLDGLSRCQAVILVGSDAPAIDAAYLSAARDALAEVDVVIGPALDGGYVLLALRRFSQRLFTDIHWGSDSVLKDTLGRVDELGWSFRLLTPLPDIDRPGDLGFLPASLAVEYTAVIQAEMLASDADSLAAASGLER